MTGGGSVAGGSVAGGMTAGGMGGGVAPTCTPGCAGFQQCVGTQCVNAELTVMAPVGGVEEPANQPLTVVVVLTFDGGVLAEPVPYETTWGRSGTTPGDGGQGSVAAPASAGQGTIRFGWTDGGPAQQSRQVNFVSCAGAAPSCQAYQQCVATTAGGRCENVPMAVSWVSPTGNTLERRCQ